MLWFTLARQSSPNINQVRLQNPQVTGVSGPPRTFKPWLHPDKLLLSSQHRSED